MAEPPAARLDALLHPAEPSSPLLIGARLPAWATLPGAAHVERAGERKILERDLIFVDLDCIEDRRDHERLLRELQTDLSPTGRLFILVRNRMSRKAVRDIILSGVRSRRRSSTPRRVRNTLRGLGFPLVDEFLLFPDPWETEEFVAADSGLLRLPSYAPLSAKLASRLNVYSKIHDGHLFLCCAGRHAQDLLPILPILAEKLDGPPLDRLLRFDLRERGALVLFLGRAGKDDPIVVRVAQGADAERIAKSQAVQLALNRANVSSTVRAVVPEPIAQIPVGSRDAFVEPMVSGSLAWKLVGTRLESRISSRAIRFAVELARSTSQQVTLEDGRLNRLFEADTIRAQGAKAIRPDLSSALQAAIAACKEGLTGERVALVRTHGDYGFGNIMVNARTGDIVGVVDWDTSRAADLPGLDLLNMEIQRHRGSRGLSQAVKELISPVLDRSLPISGAFEEFAPSVDRRGLSLFLGSCLVRYVSRSLEYPHIAIREAGELLEALSDWVRIHRELFGSETVSESGRKEP